MARYTVNVSILQYASMRFDAQDPRDAVKQFREAWDSNNLEGLTLYDDELVSVCCNGYEEG